MTKIEIAVAVAIGGQMRTCGPHDYDEADHKNAMSAAITWLLEAGEIVHATYWVSADLPDPTQRIAGGVIESKEQSE